MKQLLILIVTILFTISLKAQELDIATCRNMALKQNKQIAIAEAQTREAELAVKEAKSNFLPNISANALYLHNSEELEAATPDLPIAQGLTIPSMGIGIGLQNSFNASVSVTQPLYMGGKIISGTKMAEIGSEIYSINEARRKDEIIVECDQAYWNCIMATELAKVASKYKETLTKLLNDVKKAEKVGMKSKNDLLKVQVQLNQATLNEHRAYNSIKVAKMNLCRIIGVDINSNITLSEGIENYDTPEINNSYTFAEIPEIAILNKRIELQKESLKFTRSDYLPSAAAMVGYGYTNALTLKGTTLFTKTLIPESERLLNGGSMSAIATLKIPIFHWGEGRNKVKQAKEQIKIAELELAHANDMINLNIQVALNRIDEASQLKTMCKSAIVQADENLRVSTNHYKAGMEPLSDLLEAQTVWQKAYNDYICSCIEEQLAHLNYLKVTGQLWTIEY